MAKSNQERQAAHRARQKEKNKREAVVRANELAYISEQKKIDEAEPLLKELGQLLMKIKATGELYAKIDALTILGEILESGSYDLMLVAQDQFQENLDDNIQGAISDLVRFKWEGIPTIQQQIADVKKSMVQDKMKGLLFWRDRVQEEIEALKGSGDYDAENKMYVETISELIEAGIDQLNHTRY